MMVSDGSGREVLRLDGLRDAWMEVVQGADTASCDEVLAHLRRTGRTPVGATPKAWIRNIYSAAASHPMLVKVAPGRFGRQAAP